MDGRCCLVSYRTGCGVFTIIGGITAFGRIFDAFTDPMIASWSDRCTSKNGRRIPFLKGASLPLALSTVLVFWSPVNENSWINAAFGAAVFCGAGGLILMFYDEKKINCVMNGKA